MKMILAWPEFPRVEVLDNKIMILFKNGKTQVWGIEEDSSQRDRAIKDIQEGLRAIKFLSTSLKEFVESSYVVLNEKGFSDDQNTEYISDAIHNYLTEQRALNIHKMCFPENQPTLFYVK